MSTTDDRDAGLAFGPASPRLLALDSVVTRLEAVEQRIRRAEAERVELLAEAFDLAALESERMISSTPEGRTAELAYRAVRAEIAVALHQSERTVERHMSHAFSLTRDYPRTFEAYREGALSERHTWVITEAGGIIGAGDAPDTVLRRAAYEQSALEFAQTETPNRLQPIARRLAEQQAETSLDERHAEARVRRRVHVADAGDGMADLVAHLPAVEAYGIYDRLTRMSREFTHRDAESPRRTRDEFRADLLADLLLEGMPSGAEHRDRAGAIRAQVQVIVHEEHLVGAEAKANGTDKFTLFPHTEADESSANAAPAPPFLAGYGPIDTGSARVIAGRASHWDRTHQSPVTGEVLSVDRYRPSEQMRRLLGARDQHCRFPGCRVPIPRCDVDHTIDAARGGPTATNNLAHLCRGHHTLKHHSGWRVRQRVGGVLDWTSPTGRSHRDHPPGRVRFVPAESATASWADSPDPPPY